MKLFATGLKYPSGPIALADGSLVVVEIEGGDLTRLDRDGSRTVIAHCGGGPNGAALGPDGAFYVCNNGGLEFRWEHEVRRPVALHRDNTGGYLQRVDPASGELEVVFSHVGDRRLGSLNDIVFDRHGRCWFVDTTAGEILLADPSEGRIDTAIAGLEFPNGIDLSADGRLLYVTETYSGRLLRYDVSGRELGAATVVHTATGHGWDGIALDRAGRIWAANLEGSGVTVIAPDGAVERTLTTPVYDPHVTNVCFGGPDLETTYLTSSGRGVVYAMDTPENFSGSA